MLSLALDDHRRLRLFEERDAAELYALVAANREFLARWMPWAQGQTQENTLEFIRSGRRQLADNQGLQTAIVQDSAIVGSIGYHRIDWDHRSTSIGYWLGESAQGHGTVTRAAWALVDHALSVWKLNRVEIQAGVGNDRSRAVALRLGFTEEGVLRQIERVGERFVDHTVFSMLAQDWPASPSGSGAHVPGAVGSPAPRS